MKTLVNGIFAATGLSLVFWRYIFDVCVCLTENTIQV